MIFIYIYLAIVIITMISLFIFMNSIKFDKEHTASLKSPHYRLFKILTSSNEDMVPPKSICGYYWRYVISILLLPFTIPGVIFSYFIKGAREGIELLLSLSLIFWGILVISYRVGILIIDSNIFFSTLLGSIISIISIAIVLGGIYLVLSVSERISENINLKKENSSKKVSMISLKIKSWKDKVCPRINWRE